MKKRYILLTRTRSKYEDFYKYHFKVFDNYFELQKHLLNFWYVEKNSYRIFEETDLTKDYFFEGSKKLR